MARKHSKKGTEKHLNSQFKQCTREQERKVDGMEERVPARLYRNTSTAATDSGPRPEARKEGKSKRKVARVTPEFATTGHIAANCTKGSWNRSLDKGGSA